MDENRSADRAITAIATVFDRVSDFARALRSRKSFENAVTSTNIRQYQSGWECGKYVDSLRDGHDGVAAAWAVEVSFTGEVWLVTATTSISYGDYDEDICRLEAHSIDELDQALESAIRSIEQSAEEGSAFMSEISRYE